MKTRAVWAKRKDDDGRAVSLACALVCVSVKEIHL